MGSWTMLVFPEPIARGSHIRAFPALVRSINLTTKELALQGDPEVLWLDGTDDSEGEDDQGDRDELTAKLSRLWVFSFDMVHLMAQVEVPGAEVRAALTARGAGCADCDNRNS